MTMTAREYEILKNAGVPNKSYYTRSVIHQKFKTVNLVPEEIKRTDRNEEFPIEKEDITIVVDMNVYKFVLKI